MTPSTIASPTPSVLPRIAHFRPDAEDRPQSEVHAALRACGYPGLGEVECDLEEGDVVISGRVSTFYLKQIAQEAVSRTLPGSRVRNLIRVD